MNKGKEDHPRRTWSRSKKYCFETDYNDHFETPLKAYEDILPLLDLVAPTSNKAEDRSINGRTVCTTREHHVLYDPYYCNGRTKILLKQLGFSSAINEERDFYKDISDETCPPHHTFITNPPYSADHKKQCIQYALQGLRRNRSKSSETCCLRPSRPFFLLMPNYVATKSYYKELISHVFANGETPQDIVYIIPELPYEYDHPEGTGHSVPPFESLWFCGIGKENFDRAAKLYNNRNGKVKIATSLEELAMMGVISFGNRANPRKRRRQRKFRNETLTRPSMPGGKSSDEDFGRKLTTVDKSEKTGKMNIVKEYKLKQASSTRNKYDYSDSNRCASTKPASEGKEMKQIKLSLSSSILQAAEKNCSIALDNLQQTGGSREKKVQDKRKTGSTKSKYRDDDGVRKKKRF